jgi:hypothetical protein
MVKAYKQEHVYNHPWGRVTSASWRKFTDAENRHVLSHILDVNTLNTSLDCSSGKLYTTHAITLRCLWLVRRIIEDISLLNQLLWVQNRFRCRLVIGILVWRSLLKWKRILG